MVRTRPLPAGGPGPAQIAPARRTVLAGLAYFGLIGLACLLVEIPLIQHFILFLGQPAYALTVVLFTLLLFSGPGSRLAHSSWLPLRPGLVGLALLVMALPWSLPGLFRVRLPLAPPSRRATVPPLDFGLFSQLLRVISRLAVTLLAVHLARNKLRPGP